MNNEQEKILWDTIRIFNAIGLAEHVILIGSWAEYFYTDIFTSGFTPEIKTRDVDFMYRNINIPKEKIPLISSLRKIGFIYNEDPLTGVAKFYKEGLIELEFLTMVHGSGKSSVYPIRSLKIKSEGLREINIIADFSFEYRKNDLLIILPEPAVYVVQKILTNPTRVPANKKEKDIRSVRNMLKYIEKEDYHRNKLVEIMSSLTKKQLEILNEVCEANHIEIKTKPPI